LSVLNNLLSTLMLMSPQYSSTDINLLIDA
jgi:hypothetical protein